MNTGHGMRLSIAAFAAVGVALVAASTGSPAPTAQNQTRTAAQAACGSLATQGLAAPASRARAVARERRVRPVGRIVAMISTEDPDAEEASDPHGVAVGEGMVWVADRALDSVLVIDPARNRAVARI